MSIINSYTCVNYFMSVLVAHIFFSKFDCRPRPLYRPCMCMLYLLVLIYVMYLYLFMYVFSLKPQLDRHLPCHPLCQNYLLAIYIFKSPEIKVT